MLLNRVHLTTAGVNKFATSLPALSYAIVRMDMSWRMI
jgi:hypothetical protein